MKNLNKLQIISEKIIKNEEMRSLRGGTVPIAVFLRCVRQDGAECTRTFVDYYRDACNYARDFCNDICPGWIYSICVGGDE
jgi:hypothetical protein